MMGYMLSGVPGAVLGLLVIVLMVICVPLQVVPPPGLGPLPCPLWLPPFLGAGLQAPLPSQATSLCPQAPRQLLPGLVGRGPTGRIEQSLPPSRNRVPERAAKADPGQHGRTYDRPPSHPASGASVTSSAKWQQGTWEQRPGQARGAPRPSGPRAPVRGHRSGRAPRRPSAVAAAFTTGPRGGHAAPGLRPPGVAQLGAGGRQGARLVLAPPVSWLRPGAGAGRGARCPAGRGARSPGGA